MPFKNPHPLYSVWQGMKHRCLNPNNRMYHRYGGRGITVCDRWIANFQAFVDDMGPRPNGYTLERIDNNKGYSPENCKWASKAEQQLNLEVTRRLVVGGVEVIPALLARQLGVKTDTIVARIERGEPMDRIMSKEKLIRYGLNTGGGAANGVRQKAKTHCPQGHEFTPENTHFSKQGWRKCRACHAEREREKRALAKHNVTPVLC